MIFQVATNNRSFDPITTDINKYGIYKDCVSEYETQLFPQLDKNIMSDIKYSYNAYCFIDCAHEIYLEFTIENEDEFTKFINENKNRITQAYNDVTVRNFKHDESYTEVVVHDSIHTRKDSNGVLVIDDAYIKKLMYNEENNSIIFINLYVVDFWEFANSTYIERFNINPHYLPSIYGE